MIQIKLLNTLCMIYYRLNEYYNIFHNIKSIIIVLVLLKKYCDNTRQFFNIK